MPVRHAPKSRKQMSFFDSLLTWANLPFTATMGIVLGFMTLQVSGLLGFLAGGSHDVDHDLAHDVGHEVGHGVDHEVSHGASGSILSFMGVGKLPLSIVLQTFLMTFALSGIISNTLVLSLLGSLPAL